jgi:putative endonuclease
MPLPPGQRKLLGDAAEDAACRFLAGEGLRLLARNVRYPFGEIDLVMLDQATLVFVEVRFRSHASFGGAAASVDRGKRRKIARASQAWLASHHRYARASCRFDVVAASSAGAASKCEWIRSAFTLDDC